MITIRRGGTKKITCHIQEDVDMSSIDNVWVYLTQCVDGVNNKVVVDKKYSDSEIVMDIPERTISVKLTQEDSLALHVGTAIIQMRVHYTNGDSDPSNEETVRVLPVYKEGVMTSAN